MTQSFSRERKGLLNWLQRFGSRFETGFIVTDPTNNDAILFVNQTFTDITGFDLKEIYNKNLMFLQGEKTNMDLIAQIDREIDAGRPINEELLFYKKDGTPFWNNLTIQPIHNDQSETLFNVSFNHDITARKKGEALLQLQETSFAGMNKGESLETQLQKICDVAESFLPVGVASGVLFQAESGEWTVGAANSMPEALIHEMIYAKEEPKYVMKEPIIIQEIKGESIWASKKEVCMKYGYRACWTFPISHVDTTLSGAFTVFLKKTGPPSGTQLKFMENLTELIRRTKTFHDQQKQYERLAYTDPETGLPNHHAFLKILKTNLQNGQNYFVSILEPDEHSKLVDLYGRGAADELFIQLARRVKEAGKGKENFVGRFSSSSLVMTNEFITGDEGRHYAMKLKEISKEPFVVAGQEVFLTLKAGVITSSKKMRDAEELLRRADVALSTAKQNSGNFLAFYQNLINKEMLEEMSIFNELPKAITSDEIKLHLQPKVSLETAKIIGFEALARWYSPALGQVPPNVFIPIAESTGRIVELENTILQQVMQWLQQRIQSGKKVYQVAVNISVEHFFRPRFAEEMRELIVQYNIPSKHLRLEITESIGLVDFEKARGIFNKLNEIGFELSIDDFGVGFSSLSYLPQLKVNELKIDRSFVQALDEPDTRAVVISIIQLAKSLGLSTVAEGVEEERHIQVLLSLGCKIGQGFYFYKPMPLHEVDLLLAKT